MGISSNKKQLHKTKNKQVHTPEITEKTGKLTTQTHTGLFIVKFFPQNTHYIYRQQENNIKTYNRKKKTAGHSPFSTSICGPNMSYPHNKQFRGNSPPDMNQYYG